MVALRGSILEISLLCRCLAHYFLPIPIPRRLDRNLLWFCLLDIKRSLYMINWHI